MFAELTSSIELLKKKKQEDHAEKIFEWLLDELIRLLHYFKLASKSFEPFNTPTLHLLGVWKAKLKAHLQPRDEPVTVKGANDEDVTIPADSENIAPIKVILLNQPKEKFVLTPLHAAVTYLDPLQKNSLLGCGFTQPTIDQGLLYLKDLMRKVGAPEEPVVSMSSGKLPPVPKKSIVKRSHTIFVHARPSQDESEDDESKGNEPDENVELEARIDCEFTENRMFKASKTDKDILLQSDTRKWACHDGDVQHDVGLLPWWRMASPKFPILACATRAILCIPASSSMSECTFSSAGNTRSDKQSALHPSTLNVLLFLRFNQDLDRLM